MPLLVCRLVDRVLVMLASDSLQGSLDSRTQGCEAEERKAMQIAQLLQRNWVV
jgi:hypothetical protein